MPSWLTPDLQAQLLDGLVITIALTIGTGALALLVGIVVGLGSEWPNRAVRMASGAFVEVFRNVPALILIIFFAFAIPKLFPADLRRTLFFANPGIDWIGRVTGIPLPYYAIAASLGLILNSGAHLAEIFRTGLRSLPAERIEVARSLGAGRLHVVRTVVVPDALRTSFPAISTRLVHNMKNTALVSFVAVPDLFQTIQGSITKTFRATELLLLAALLYLALAALMTFLLRRVELRITRGRRTRRDIGV